jgi:hypothetical protein
MVWSWFAWCSSGLLLERDIDYGMGSLRTRIGWRYSLLHVLGFHSLDVPTGNVPRARKGCFLEDTPIELFNI